MNETGKFPRVLWYRKYAGAQPTIRHFFFPPLRKGESRAFPLFAQAFLRRILSHEY